MEQLARPSPFYSRLGKHLSSALDPFRAPSFGVYWVSNALFFIGQGLVLLGAQWLMLSLTQSRTVLGLMGAIQAGVVIALTPVAGILGDRVARRDLLIAGRLGFAVVTLGMGVAVLVDAAEVWLILASVGVSSVFLAISQPASQSYVTDIVGQDRLMTALALNALATGVFQVLAPSVGGGLVAAVGSDATYLTGGAGYVIGALLLATIPIRGRTTGQARGSFWADTGAGLRHLRVDPLLRWVFLPTTVVTIFAGAILAMRPVFAREVLDVGASGLGWLGAAFGAGSLLGSFIVIALGPRLKLKGLVLLLGPLVWVTCMVFYAISPWFTLTLVLEAGMGLTSPFWATSVMTILQVRVPEQLRSRVLAVHFMIMQGMQLNWLLTGFVADMIGDRQALFWMGLIPTVFLLVLLVTLRQLVTLGSDANPLVTYVPESAAKPARP
ncbi:MAG: MFS transporter [Dehalococcoidia bacterium]